MKKEILELQKIMIEKNIDAYIVVTDDFHGSEYVGDFFKAREFMSDFTGSAGTLVVLRENAALWTDGRYFLQAEKELAGSGINLMKMGNEGVPTIAEFLAKELPDNARVGFDGRTISLNFADNLCAKLEHKNIEFVYDDDLVDGVWTNRPQLSKEPVWELEIQYAGKSTNDKFADIRRKMDENDVNIAVITALDEIAWLLNLRGNDVECTPVFLAYMVIEKNRAHLYAHEEIFRGDTLKVLINNEIELKKYESVYEEIKSLTCEKNVLLDKSTANYKLYKCISNAKNIVKGDSYINTMKAVKNPTEIKNMVIAHIKDGVAVTKYIHWLKTNVANSSITELDAVAKIEELRHEMTNYIEPSFATIAGYGKNGAIIHYEPTSESNTLMKDSGFCLTDTGGHYLEGTTDVTRTIPLGALTDDEKIAYTLVMKGHLRLANTHFKYGVTGANLDVLARGPLWEHGLDFNHGTGHGVGYLLSVHGGPQRIHFKGGNVVFEEGMIVSDEPGLYIEDKFGIRHESLLLVQKGEKTEYGQMMYFENLTLVPFDAEGIDKSLMNDEEIRWFNDYQRNVYETLEPYFDGEELIWLKNYTKSI